MTDLDTIELAEKVYAAMCGAKAHNENYRSLAIYSLAAAKVFYEELEQIKKATLAEKREEERKKASQMLTEARPGPSEF